MSRPNSFAEASKANFPNRSFFGITVSLIRELVFYPAVAPGAVIALLIFAFNPAWSTFFFATFIIALNRAGGELGQVNNAVLELRRVIWLLRDTIIPNFKISEHLPTDYLTPEVLNDIDKIRPMSLVSNHTTARIFSFTPYVPNTIMEAWKAYVPMRAQVPQPLEDGFSISKIQNNAMVPGYIFTDTMPEKSSLFTRFKIAHEMSHCSGLSVRIKRQSAQSLVSIAGLFIVIFLLNLQSIFYLLAVCYGCLRLLETLPAYRALYDEKMADMCAIYALRNDSDIDKILSVHKESLSRTKSIPTIQRVSRIKVAENADRKFKNHLDYKPNFISHSRSVLLFIALAFMGLAILTLFISLNYDFELVDDHWIYILPSLIIVYFTFVGHLSDLSTLFRSVADQTIEDAMEFGEALDTDISPEQRVSAFDYLQDKKRNAGGYHKHIGRKKGLPLLMVLVGILYGGFRLVFVVARNEGVPIPIALLTALVQGLIGQLKYVLGAFIPGVMMIFFSSLILLVAYAFVFPLTLLL